MARFISLHSGNVFPETGTSIVTRADLNRMFDGGFGQISGILPVADMETGALDATYAGPLSTNSLTAAIPALFNFTWDATVTANYDYVLNHSFKVVKAWVQINSSSGNNNTIQLSNNSTPVNITEALSLNPLAGAGDTLDFVTLANNSIAAGETLRIAATASVTLPSGTAYLFGHLT